MVIEYSGKRPRVGKNVFIAPTAVVLGDEEIGEGASIWYGAVLRGDQSLIKVGKNTNIQDNCTIHTDSFCPVVIGDNVTIGHNAVIHGCTIDDDCLIGIGAIILSDAHIKKVSVVASGAVVKEGQVIGPYHFVTGVPAQLKKILLEDAITDNRKTVQTYCNLAMKHMQIKGV